jgi:hypothetical protein
METIGNTFTGGLNGDYHARFIPQGDYRYALNCIADSEESLGVLTSENGNDFYVTLKTGYSLVGTINTNQNSFILFSTDNTNSEIGLYENNKYTPLVNASCLNFNTKNPIHGVFRVRNGCERIIYFTDRTNPLRVINLDELNSYKNADGSWDCTRFSLSRNVQFPTMSFTIQDNGGSLEAGSYQFLVRMLDADGNSSNWSLLSYIIPISLGSQFGTWTSIKGAYEDKYFDVSKGSVPNTNKAIKISLSNLDTSYKYYQLAVVKNLEGLGITTTTSILPKVAFTNSTSSFTYTGSISIEEEASIEEVTIDKIPIDIVNSIESANNSLWLGGVKTKSYDWSSFQRAASKIIARPKVVQIPAYELGNGNPKSYNYSGYTPDEIENFGIVYVFKDGTYSPEFHIVGRDIIDSVESSLLTI